MQKYGKAIIAVLTAVLVAVYQSRSGDGVVSRVEWVSIVIAFVTALGVFLVPLAPQAKWGKTAVAGVLALLQVLVTAIVDGLGPDDLILIFITVVGALGIYIAPAISEDNGVPAVAVGTGGDH